MVKPSLVLPFVLLVAGCGGSSSETPPPVEPAVERLHMDEDTPPSPESAPREQAQKAPDSEKPE